jgi:hypothetical protein
MPTVNAQGPLWVDNTIIAAITESQQEQAERRRPRKYLDRVPLVPADDEDIISIWTANRIAADVIAPNQAARTVAAGSLQFNVHELPNIKIGAHLNQQDINRIERLRMKQQAGIAGKEAQFLFWDSIVRQSREGVLDRLNNLAAQMLIGNLNYNRLGVQISSNMLMPTDLKVTVSIPWTSASATPVTDIANQKRYCELTYGFVPNRATMARADWINMLKTTQFAQLGQSLYKIAATNVVNVDNWPLMQTLFSQLTDLVVEIDDHAIRTENADGTVQIIKDIPDGTVLLTSTMDDNDPSMFDIGNAPLTEALVSNLVGTPVDLGGQERGPAVFATTDHQLNPPQITVWGAARAFPRRKALACSTVLIVQ